MNDEVNFVKFSIPPKNLIQHCVLDIAEIYEPVTILEVHKTFVASLFEGCPFHLEAVIHACSQLWMPQDGFHDLATGWLSRPRAKY